MGNLKADEMAACLGGNQAGAMVVLTEILLVDSRDTAAAVMLVIVWALLMAELRGYYLVHSMVPSMVARLAAGKA